MPPRLSQTEFLNRAKQVHPTLDYSNTVYNNAISKIKVRCTKHGEFEQLPFNHLKGVGGCPSCGFEIRNQKLTLDTAAFIEKASRVHNGKYDYSKVDYQGFNSKVTILCPQHGAFEQRANNHLAGIGCNKCGCMASRTALLKTYRVSKNNKLQSTQSTPLMKNKRVFQCQCGRISLQSGYTVENGLVKTCGNCSSLPKNYWITQTWGYLQLDHNQEFPNEWAPQASIKLKVICRCGNRTRVIMASLTNGHTLSCGCLVPGKSEHSPAKKIEGYIADLGASFSSDDRSIISPLELDIWISDSHLAIEFNGQYYHSLDGTESPIAKYRHRDKFNLCQQKGILLLQIDEHEWNNPVTREVWKSVIASKLGKHNKIPARKTTFQPISSIEANAFLAVNHLQGVTPALRWAFGLFHNNELVGVITFCYHQRTQINLSRLAFKLNTTVIGGAQKLFKNAIPFLPVGDIVSFSNNQYSNGAIYRTLGFTKVGDLQPSYQWYFKGRIWNKRSLRKDKLANLLPDFNPSETEHQNLYRNGARCLYDAGYQRWLYKKPLLIPIDEDSNAQVHQLICSHQPPTPAFCRDS